MSTNESEALHYLARAKAHRAQGRCYAAQAAAYRAYADATILDLIREDRRECAAELLKYAISFDENARAYELMALSAEESAARLRELVTA